MPEPEGQIPADDAGDIQQSDFETFGKKPEPPKEETKAEPEAKDTKGEAEEKPDGTPDKLQQKIDQRMTALNDAIEKLNSKLEAGTATPKDVQKFEKQKDELEELLDEKRAENPDFDAIKDQRTLAKRQIDAEKRNEALEARLAKVEENEAFNEQARRFPDVNVRDVWKTAQDDAAKAIGKKITTAKLEHLSAADIAKLQYAEAMELYEARADAAQKSQKAKGTTLPKVTAPTPDPKGAPNGAKVTIGTRSPGPTPQDSGDFTAEDFATLKR